MASLPDLSGTAARILAVFAEHLEALGVTLPDRQHVAPGAVPVWDGEQLVVHLSTIQQGQPGAEIGTTMAPTAVTFVAQFAVTLVRSVQSLQPDGPLAAMIPGDADISADGAMVLGDAAAVIRAAAEIHGSYDLAGPGEGFVIGPLIPLGPQGGLAANRLLLALSLT